MADSTNGVTDGSKGAGLRDQVLRPPEVTGMNETKHTKIIDTVSVGSNLD